MARDLEIGVETKGAAKAGQEVGRLGRAFDDLGDEMQGAAVDAGKLSRDLAKLEAQTAVAAKSVHALDRAFDDLGDEMAGAARGTTKLGRDLAALDAKLVASKAAAKALGAEFAQTGDIDVLKRFRAQSTQTSALTRIRKELAGVNDELTHGSQLASTFASFIQGGILKALTTPAGAITAASVAVPAVIGAGATAGGAITAGVGLGAVGGGIAGAAMQSKAVQDEWTKTTTAIKRQFLDATTSFEAPTLSAIRKIDVAFRDIDMKKIFGDASKFVEPLADGAATAVALIGDGVEYLVAHGEPAIAAIGGVLTDLGGAVKIAMEQIGGGSEGGAKAIRDLGIALSDTIIVVGTWIGWLEDAYDALDKFRNGLADVHPAARLMRDIWTDDAPKSFARRLDAITVSAEGTAKGIAKTAQDFATLAAVLSSTAANAETLAGAMTDRILGAALDADHATLSWNESLTRLSDTLKENKRSLDIHTAAGQADREAVLAAVEANQRIYDVMIASGASAEEAAIAYDKNTAALEAQLRKAGLTQAQIDGLIGKYRDVPDNVNTNIAMNGLTEAINSLADLIAKINHIDNKNFHSTYTLIYKTQGRPPTGEQGTIPLRGAYASGTDYARGGLALVGEKGPEIVDLPAGAKVYNADETAQMMAPPGYAQPAGWSAWTGRSGDTAPRIYVTVNAGMGTDGYRVGRQIADALRDYVGPSGGNVQDAVMRRG